MPRVNIDQTVQREAPPTAFADVVQLEGDLGSDHDGELFRLYPEAVNRRSYYLIRRKDVDGDIYQWDQRELAAAGFSGQTRYRVAVKANATAQWITTRSGPLSTLEAGSAAPFIPGGAVVSAAIGGGRQLASSDLQNMLQKQLQQMLQTMSKLMKMMHDMHDIHMSIIRNMAA